MFNKVVSIKLFNYVDHSLQEVIISSMYVKYI